MTRNITLIPLEKNCGITSVSLGVVRSLEQQGVKVGFFQIISEEKTEINKPTTTLLKSNPNILIIEPIDFNIVTDAFTNDRMDVFIEIVLNKINDGLAKHPVDVMIIEGCISSAELPFAGKINQEITKLLDADMVLVTHPKNDNSQGLKRRIEMAAADYGGMENERISGIIINKLGAPINHDKGSADLSDVVNRTSNYGENNHLEILGVFSHTPFHILGCIPWNIDILSPRVADIHQYLNSRIINKGELDTRRIKSITFCARSMQNMIDMFKTGSLLVAAFDRPDVIIAASLAAMNGIKIAGLLLTSDGDPDPKIMELCQQALSTGLPILSIKTNTWDTAQNLTSFNLRVPQDDIERIDAIKEYIAGYIDRNWIKNLLTKQNYQTNINPAAFKYNLVEKAKKQLKTIILPEGNDARTIAAASLCADKDVVKPILIGDRAEIELIAKQQDIKLNSKIQIISNETIQKKYIDRLVELREKKGMTAIIAAEQLKNPVVFATLMLEMGEVDGLVSGAIHTTADTIRPALQLIKTGKGNNIVSSIFFMLLPNQVLIYGDCAINPDPNAEQLADIAIQSAESAKQFGVEPKIAMISYSTGLSGSGVDVDKVREATQIVQKLRPDLIIDGPLQYDAAITEKVARSKAPNSPVAGHANVFIFPDLNTGNTTYKAVQRSANLISIGPMLQGLNKPVNDLSRGASVKDIFYTIALTAIQAQK